MNIITIHHECFISASPPRPTETLAPTVNASCTTEQIILQYPEVFKCLLGTLPGEVHLEIDTEVQPVVTPPPPTNSYSAYRPKFKDELDRLQKLGVITPVSEPTPWVSSVAIATKKSGDIRVCIEIFQKKVKQALDGHDGKLNIDDDILLYGVGETKEEVEKYHDAKLARLLHRCKQTGIALINSDKLKLKGSRIHGTHPHWKRYYDRLRQGEMLPSTTVEEVQRLHGFVNYLAKFLPQLATIMEPIRQLTRKDATWEWSQR